MTDETAASWPEQDAVDAWMEERGFYVSHEATMALKTAVTAERIRQQRAFLQARADRDHLAADLSAAQAQIEALRGAAGNAAMYLEGGFINCPRCGEEVQTKHTDAEHALRAALDADAEAARARVRDLTADLSAAQAQIEALRGAVDDADSALTEAEAILGGEYGDHYGPLCEMMLGLRAKIAALPAKEGE